MINPYRTLNAKNWDTIRVATAYPSGKKLLLLDECNDKQEKWAEAIERSIDDFEWSFADSFIIDENYIAYHQDGYTESDAIIMDGWVLGRKMIEDDELDLDEIFPSFINVNNRALPSWITPPKPWEERSCDFAHGMYGQTDQPKEIHTKLSEEGFDTMFQIASLSPFEVNFCVWTKKREA